MESAGQLAVQLEQKRRRARRGYMAYGCGLSAAVLLAFAADVRWAGAVFAVTFLLYLLVVRRDVAGYKKGLREARIRLGVRRYIAACSVADKNLFPSDQMRADGFLPPDTAGGVVRVGVRGVLKNGVRVEMADVAFPVNAGGRGEKRSRRILSGCYLRFAFHGAGGSGGKGESGATGGSRRPDHGRGSNGMGGARFVYISHRHDLREMLEKYYEEELGFRGFPCPEMIQRARALDRDAPAGVVLVADGEMLYLFLAKCYLETGEPGYKRPVTPQSLENPWFEPLEHVMSLAKVWQQALCSNPSGL